MLEYSTRLLFRPKTAEQRFLPEGPYPCGDGRLSWVSIQHGTDQTAGSLNLLDLAAGTNRNIPLPGRPGFAFPTNRDGEFVIGLEREVGLFRIEDATWTPLTESLETDVDNTIINDGVVFTGGLVFGCKDPEFTEPKAGLYLWRRSDGKTIKLRHDQICSNGKVVFGDGDTVTLLDIDTPTKQVVHYSLNVATGERSEPEVIVDLTARVDFPDDFPDGMIATPDGQSVIIAFYHPEKTGPVDFGTARQYSLADGSLEAVWTVEKSPRVTCPQLVRLDGSVKLILTTADEGMTPEQQARHTNAGCLFIADTDFDDVPDTPMFNVPE
ncbi:SMP-30/gluconolactonase/LRE family protein [bacterium]|nr:SMP-30/gluconolactonase/LRE family protein [bacterium]